MDPIELPEYWIANDFITFRFFYAGGAKEHMVNLTKHEELTADEKILLEFRHNAYGDPENKSLYGYVSFPLKEVFNEVTDSVCFSFRSCSCIFYQPHASVKEKGNPDNDDVTTNEVCFTGNSTISKM